MEALRRQNLIREFYEHSQKEMRLQHRSAVGFYTRGWRTPRRLGDPEKKLVHACSNPLRSTPVTLLLPLPASASCPFSAEPFYIIFSLDTSSFQPYSSFTFTQPPLPLSPILFSHARPPPLATRFSRSFQCRFLDWFWDNLA